MCTPVVFLSTAKVGLLYDSDSPVPKFWNCLSRIVKSAARNKILVKRDYAGASFDKSRTLLDWVVNNFRFWERTVMMSVCHPDDSSNSIDLNSAAVNKYLHSDPHLTSCAGIALQYFFSV